VMGRREVGFSRRLDLPPGLYHLRLRGQAILAAKATRDGAARIEMRSDALVLAAARVEAGTLPPALMLPLPAGARRLALRVESLGSEVEISEAQLVPEALVPRRKRGDFFWPRFPREDLYRVGSGAVKTTVLDRSAADREGFVLDGGEGRFLVDAPAAAAQVVVRVRRARASMTDALSWGPRSVPLGTSPEVVLRLGLDDGEPLGSLRVVPVRLRSQEAWVSFSSGDR